MKIDMETKGVWGACALAIALVMSISGCSRAASSRPMPALALVAPAAAGGGVAGASPPSADRAMRITVDTTILVAHRDAALAALRSLVSGAGGHVSEGTVTGPDEGGSARFTVKVPSGAVEGFRARLSELGEVKSDSEKAEDVTEARADLRARLHNARAEEQRFLDLLANHTGNLADVVLVEKEIATVRETIERMEAEERTLEGQISLATITVALETRYVAVSEGAGSQIAAAALTGIDAAKGFLLGTATVTLSAGPTLLIIAAMGYGVFLVLRTWRRRRHAAAPLP
jgi:hypothetical protein